MGNRWKIAFYSLLTVFLAIIVALIGFYNHYLPPAEEAEFSRPADFDAGEPIFSVSTTTQQLESLINRKLKEHNRQSKLKYTFLIKEDLVLKGKIPFVGEQIPFVMTFSPEVLEHGNLMLHEQSMRLGLLRLPESKVLEYVKQSADLPEWVNILPKKKKIFIALKDIRIEDQFYLRAKQLDLEQNKIKFSVYTLK